MKVLFIQYERCSTCKKAKAWLDAQGCDYINRPIVTEAPTIEELRQWWQQSGLPLKRFFNTSGMKYRELGLATALPSMGEEEQLQLLASDGMLVKRPLLITSKGVFPGFREAEWTTLIKA